MVVAGRNRRYGPAPIWSIPLTRPFVLVVCLASLAAGLSACGRRSALDVPATVEQALPGTPADELARNPPRDAEGRRVAQPRLAGPRPLADSFPLDPLMR